MTKTTDTAIDEAGDECTYVDPEGIQCHEQRVDGEFCYWHSGHISDLQGEVRAQLETQARAGVPLRGFKLSHTDLSGINLVAEGEAFCMAGADLYRANLQDAHLFRVDLHGASLMKADLSGANLHCANLQDCNLLGAKFNGAKLDNVHWGNNVLQERRGLLAEVEGDLSYAKQNYQEAEEIYRELSRICEKQGLSEESGHFFQSAMKMRRLQMPKYSPHRMLSRVVDLFCGYGEEPIRIIFFSWMMILFFAALYFAFGISSAAGIVGLSWENTLAENLWALLECSYFSIVTFTTLGYGDLTPVGWTRAVAALEAFSGSFTMALFVVVFVKKMTR